MGQILHGSATTTAAVRRAIQHSQESLRGLAKRYGVNPKTVAKWKKRTSTVDVPTGPREPRSTVLTPEEEAVIVAFRRHTLLPLDDCLYALQPTIPHLTRSSLHRCLQRHGISRLPDVDGDLPAKKKFKTYPIGYFHIDIAEVQTAEGKLYLCAVKDACSKRIVGYFVRDAQVCNLTLMMGDSMESDEVPTNTPTRILQTIAPNSMARVDTTEGESFEFSCKSGATAMTVRILTDVAAYKAK